jgi:hypothetical protein
MALAHPGSLPVPRPIGWHVRLADGLDHRPELVYGLPGVEQLALGARLPPLHPVELGYLACRPFLTRLPKALLMSLAGEALFDIHGGEDLFALCAYVCWA